MRFSLFGPLLYFDLLRTTRRGRTFLLRAAYSGVILASLFLYYYLWLPTDQRPPLFELAPLTGPRPAHSVQNFRANPPAR